MVDCTKCANRNNDYCIFACENGESFKPITKADHIRAMTDEELAETMLDCFAAFYDVEWSKQDILDWLKEEAEK